MMNWKGFGRKQVWPSFKVLSQYLPGWTEETTKTSVRIAYLGAKIRTWDLPNMNREC
jgi:hypothetical protein